MYANETKRKLGESEAVKETRKNRNLRHIVQTVQHLLIKF